MRRTDQEFKAEVMRRSREYKKKRAEKRKKLLTAFSCVAFCIFTFGMLLTGPMFRAGSSADCAEPESQMINGSKMEADMEAPAQANDEKTGEGALGEVPAIVYSVWEERYFSISANDFSTIVGYLEGEWGFGLTDCITDFTFSIGDKEYHYCSDCGTFLDWEGECHLTVLEEDRQWINFTLEQYLN